MPNNTSTLARLKEISVYIRSPHGKHGSGYLVAPGYIGTALHVVASWPQDYDGDVLVGHGETQRKCKARLIRGDKTTDAALLKLLDGPDVPAMTVSGRPRLDAKWSGYGFPAVANASGKETGMPIDGRVRDPNTTNNVGQPSILLYSHAIAAGNAAPIQGFSGSPIVVDGMLIGHLTKVISDPNDARRGAFGYVYACPISAVVALMDEADRPTLAAPAPPLPWSVRNDLAKFYATYHGTAESQVPFGGRHTQIAQLIAWAVDPARASRCVVTGPMGRGKSALMIRVAEALRAVDDQGGDGWQVVLVPVSMRFQTHAADVYLQILSIWLGYISGDAPESSALPQARLRYASECAAAVNSIIESGRKLLIIVDGIDEALGGDFSASWFPEQTNGRVKLLLSARTQLGQEDGGGWLTKLDWSRDCEQLTLTALGPPEIADMLRSAGVAAADMVNGPALIDRLLLLSDGEPFLLALYVEDLWPIGRQRKPVGVADLELCQPGFGDYFRRWMAQQEAAWQLEHQQGIPIDLQSVYAHLAVLACARGRLASRDLAALVFQAHGIRPGFVTENSLWPVRRFVIGVDRAQRPSAQSYVLAHPKLAEFFIGHLAAEKIDQTRRAFIKLGAAIIPDLDSGRVKPGQANPYYIEFLSRHLDDAGAPADAYDILLSPGWRAAHVAFDGNMTGFIRDVRMAAAAVATQRQPAWRSMLLGRNLVLSSARAAAAVPSALMMASIEHGLVHPDAALRALEAVDDDTKWKGLLKLAPRLPSARRSHVIDDALLYARRMERGPDRAVALASIMSSLAEDRRDAILDEVFDQFGLLGNMAGLLQTVDSIAPLVDAPARWTMLRYLLAAIDSENSWYYLLNLLPHMDESERLDSIMLAAEINLELPDRQLADLDAGQVLVPGLSGNLLATIFRFLPSSSRPALKEAALRAVRDCDVPLIKVAGLIGVIACEGKGGYEQYQDEVMQALSQQFFSYETILFTAELARHLPEPQRADIIAPALAIACRDIQTDSFSRFTALADVLDGAGLETALAAIATAGQRSAKAAALDDLAPRLNREQTAAALAMLERVGDDEVCAAALSALATPLIAGEQPPDLTQKDIDEVAQWLGSPQERLDGPAAHSRFMHICTRLRGLPLHLKQRAYERMAVEVEQVDRTFAIHYVGQCAAAIREIDGDEGLPAIQAGIAAARATFP